MSADGAAAAEPGGRGHVCSAECSRPAKPGGVRSDSAASPRARASAAHDDLARPVIWGGRVSSDSGVQETAPIFFFSFVSLPADRCDDSVVLRLSHRGMAFNCLFTHSTVLCFVLVSTKDLSPFCRFPAVLQ